MDLELTKTLPFTSRSVHQGIVHLVIYLLTLTVHSQKQRNFDVLRLSTLCKGNGSSFGMIGGVGQTECPCTWQFLMDLDRG